VRSGASARFNEVLSIVLSFRYPYALQEKRIPRGSAQRLLSVASGQ